MLRTAARNLSSEVVSQHVRSAALQADDDIATGVQKIGELADKASAEADTPLAVLTILSEIASLACARFNGTRESSDVPQTENPSLSMAPRLGGDIY